MLGANEPITRPAEHDKHPNMAVTRTPNLLMMAPITGPRRQQPPIMIDEVQAARQREPCQLLGASGA